MLQTTIYNQSNAVLTGTYHRYDGECVTVEFLGSELECECYINAVNQDDDGRNEVQHVLTRVSSHSAPAQTSFALHNVWMVHSTM
jgi:hypothetical protein